MESGEFRVEMWCVRLADTFLYGAMIFIAIIPLVVGASIARPRGLPVISHWSGRLQRAAYMPPLQSNP